MFAYQLVESDLKSTISFDGDLDIDVTELMEEEITPRLRKSVEVDIDFSSVHFVDSSGIGLLISLVQSLSDWGTKVRIYHLNEDVKLVFDMLQLPDILGPDVLMDFPYGGQDS
jgi:anti-anti-sigma factor